MSNGRDSAGPPPQPEDEVWSDTSPVPADLEPPAIDDEDGEPTEVHDLHDLSKADYARTTSGTPDHTAMIPVIRDEPAVTSSTAVVDPIAEKPEPAWMRKPEPPEPAESSTAARPAGLRLVRVEPYSVTRLAFVVSVALMIVSVVAVAIIWIMLSITGVWGQINDSVASLLSDDSASFDITDYLGFGRMVGGTLVLSGINVILMTGLATVGAHLYNLAAALLGGVEATFSDD